MSVGWSGGKGGTRSSRASLFAGMEKAQLSVGERMLRVIKKTLGRGIDTRKGNMNVSSSTSQHQNPNDSFTNGIFDVQQSSFDASMFSQDIDDDTLLDGEEREFRAALRARRERGSSSTSKEQLTSHLLSAQAMFGEAGTVLISSDHGSSRGSRRGSSRGAKKAKPASRGSQMSAASVLNVFT